MMLMLRVVANETFFVCRECACKETDIAADE